MNNFNQYNNPMNLNSVPTVKSLWKNEKSQYRHWIVMFYGALAVLIIMFVIGFVLTMLNRDSIIAAVFKQISTGNTKATMNDARAIVLRDDIVIPGVMIGLFLVCFVLWTSTTIESYKNKTFSKLSVFPIVIIEMTGFFALMNVVFFFFKLGQSTSSPAQIILFVNQFILVFAAFFAMKVSSIKRRFQISERVEMLKTNPQFNNMMNGQQMGNPFFNNPNNFKNQPNQNPNNPQNNAPNNPAFGPTATNNPITKQQKREAELEKLTLGQLKDMAAQLSIAGYETMTYSELLTVIKKLSANQN